MILNYSLRDYMFQNYPPESVKYIFQKVNQNMNEDGISSFGMLLIASPTDTVPQFYCK